MFWDQRFLDPIMLPDRKPPLVSLRDAAQYITKLPKAEHDAEDALLLVAEHDGPPMFARIGIMRALNRGYVREFSSRARTRIGGANNLAKRRDNGSSRNTSWTCEKSLKTSASFSTKGRLSAATSSHAQEV
jgi:hypothetical protein